MENLGTVYLLSTNRGQTTFTITNNRGPRFHQFKNCRLVTRQPASGWLPRCGTIPARQNQRFFLK